MKMYINTGSLQHHTSLTGTRLEKRSVEALATSTCQASARLARATKSNRTSVPAVIAAIIEQETCLSGAESYTPQCH
jgi:hypothetical protein